eukprot:3476496-Amphidinium_carterae.1
MQTPKKLGQHHHHTLHDQKTESSEINQHKLVKSTAVCFGLADDLSVLIITLSSLVLSKELNM